MQNVAKCLCAILYICICIYTKILGIGWFYWFLCLQELKNVGRSLGSASTARTTDRKQCAFMDILGFMFADASKQLLNPSNIENKTLIYYTKCNWKPFIYSCFAINGFLAMVHAFQEPKATRFPKPSCEFQDDGSGLMKLAHRPHKQNRISIATGAVNGCWPQKETQTDRKCDAIQSRLTICTALPYTCNTYIRIHMQKKTCIYVYMYIAMVCCAVLCLV